MTYSALEESKGWFDSWKFLDDGLTWSCPLWMARCSALRQEIVVAVWTIIADRPPAQISTSASTHKALTKDEWRRSVHRNKGAERRWRNPPVRYMCARHPDRQLPVKGKSSSKPLQIISKLGIENLHPHCESFTPSHSSFRWLSNYKIRNSRGIHP
jgi:hypothetical protein